MINDSKAKISFNKENSIDNSADISKNSFDQKKIFSLKRHYEEEEIERRKRK